MKSDYNKLQEKHEKEIEDLQNQCPHTKKERMDIWWAPGHVSGQGLFCLNCNKRLDKPKCMHFGRDKNNKCLFCGKQIGGKKNEGDKRRGKPHTGKGRH